MNKNKKIGMMLILLPPILFIVSLVGYAVASAILNHQLVQLTTTTTVNPNITVFIIVRMVMGLLGILGILGVFTSIPAGIYFLIKKEKILL